jgi:virulence activator alpha
LLTDAGRAALRAWLESPLTPDAIAVQLDPVRTRMFFLGALEPAARVRLLAEVERRLDEESERVRSYERHELAPDDEFGRLASRGAQRAMQARLEWIRELRRALDPRPIATATGRRARPRS